MNEKEKAKELVYEFLHMGDVKKAKEHALICVKEMVKVSLEVEFEFNGSGNSTQNINYLKGVKREIELL